MLSRAYGEKEEEKQESNPEEDLKPMSAIPLGRFGEPSEAAKLFAFLLSDDLSYIMGSVHLVDGGALS
jgi:NAD(P)-dependent dehydrogenase (short-subunit alcohol dehydrogenase family)